MKIVVPGNLLLFGEYAITFPGGLGIAVATDTPLIIDIQPSSEFLLTGIFEGNSYRWTKGQEYSNRLIELILKEIDHFPNQHLHIDSSAFCYEDGSKKGFGSSAAVTVGLTFALLQKKLEREPDILTELFPLALQIHRNFQNGKGSGYDILTSIMGGVGLFEGGDLPSWTAIDKELYRNLSLARGNNSFDTKSGLKQLAQLNPNLTEKFLRVSNKIVKLGITSPRAFTYARMLNLWINRQLDIPIQWSDSNIKALGAGSELGVSLTAHGDPLHISKIGLQCLI